MKSRAIVGLVAGCTLLLSAIPHAFMGWPSFEPVLAAASVDGEAVTGLKIGWLYGSFTMAGFGAIVILAAWSSLRRTAPPGSAPAVVAIATLAFGLWAYLGHGMHPHFLLFIAQGLLVGYYAVPARSRA